MSILALSPLGRLAGIVPLIVRVIVGVIMVAHGLGSSREGRASSAAGCSPASACRSRC